MEVTLYTQTDCRNCENAKALLDELGQAYTEKDVANTENLGDLLHHTGEYAVPALVVGDQVLVGYHRGKIKHVLKKK